MTGPSQPSDRLREILRQARRGTPAPGARAVEADATEAGALVDRHAQLPDPMALSRMYRSLELRERLVDDAGEAAPSTEGPAGRDRLEAPTAAAPRRDERESVREGPTRPAMSPAEIRAVMAELHDRFSGSERSYETYELSSRPADEIPTLSREEREAQRTAAVSAFEETTGGGWVYVVGGVLTVGVILLFIYLAMYGPAPFRAGSTPSASPSVPATASAAR